jgi:fibronectin-binding autotransporter adhesin
MKYFIIPTCAAVAALSIVTSAQSATLLSGDARLSQNQGAEGDQLRTGEVSGGTVVINDGTTVTLNRGTSPNLASEAATGVIVGRRAGPTNTLDIDGASLIIDSAGAAGFFQIARDGVDAQVTLSFGAYLEMRDDLAPSGTASTSGEGISVGRSGAGTGTLNVIDSEILITSTSGAFINGGREGANANITFDNATVTLEDRDPNPAALSSASITLGRDTGSDAQMLITNGSRLSLSSTNGFAGVTVGGAFNSTAELTLDMGSIIDLSTAGPPGSFGADLHVGQQGVGVMNVRNGSKVLFTSSDGQIFVGVPGDNRPFAGNGTLSISDSGSEVAATDIIGVGRTDWNDPNRTSDGGLIEVFNGGTLSTQNGMHIGTNGEIRTDTDVRIGTGAVATPNGANVLAERYTIVSDGGRLTAQTVHVDAGGYLGGNGGIVDATVSLNGGVIGPGASPGSMTILGDLIYTGGFIDLEIGGTAPGEFDFLDIFGSLILPTTSIMDLLRITLLDSYQAQAGDSFDLLNFDSLIGGPITASFFDENGQQLTGYSFGSTTGSGSFGFAVNSVPDVAAVPLPASLPMLLAGLGFLAFRRRFLTS